MPQIEKHIDATPLPPSLKHRHRRLSGPAFLSEREPFTLGEPGLAASAALRRVLARQGWVELPYEEMTRARPNASGDGMHFQAQAKSLQKPSHHAERAVVAARSSKRTRSGDVRGLPACARVSPPEELQGRHMERAARWCCLERGFENGIGRLHPLPLLLCLPQALALFSK
jgi:hypothetical protein